jgi:peptidylprolyl isomerase
MKIESVNPCVYLDIRINSEKIGRVVIELLQDEAPKASENFLHLCKSDVTLGDGTLLTLRNNHFHRVVKNFMVQAGDLTYGSSDSLESNVGLGGASIWSDKLIRDGAVATGFFEDENLTNFETTFNVAMANSGADTNASQFFVNTYPAPHLNGKHTVFGKVIHGKSTIRTIEYECIDENGTPQRNIVIEDCGEWTEELGVPVHNASYSTLCGDIYEEFPDDDDHFDKDKSSEAYDVSVKIKDSGSALFVEKKYLEAYLKYKKTLRYVNEFIPDSESDPEYAPKFEDLKKKTYNNLSLVCINLKDYEKALTYASYLLECDGLTTIERAKGHYRRAISEFELGKYEESYNDFKECLILNPDDEVVKKKIEIAEAKLKALKDKEKQKYAKFFG